MAESRLYYKAIPEKCDLCRAHEARFEVWVDPEGQAERLIAKVCSECKRRRCRNETPDQLETYMRVVLGKEPRSVAEGRSPVR